MRRAVLLAALAASPVPCAAGADGGATLPFGPAGVNVAFTGPGTRTLMIHLDADHDYALETLGGYDGGAEVRDASGRVLASAIITGDNSEGASFHAAYSGDYFVDVTDQGVPAGETDQEWVAIDRDCAAGQRTRCTLPVGSTSTIETFNYESDKDWWSASLRGGRTYDIHLQLGPGGGGEFVFLRALDADRHAVVPWACTDETRNGACDLTFRAPRNGTYYVLTAWGGAPSPSGYSISLSAR